VDSASNWVVDSDRCNDDDCVVNLAVGRAVNLVVVGGGDRGGVWSCDSGDPSPGEYTCGMGELEMARSNYKMPSVKTKCACSAGTCSKVLTSGGKGSSVQLSCSSKTLCLSSSESLVLSSHSSRLGPWRGRAFISMYRKGKLTHCDLDRQQTTVTVFLKIPCSDVLIWSVYADVNLNFAPILHKLERKTT
jgi:hypothetical protein